MSAPRSFGTSPGWRPLLATLGYFALVASLAGAAYGTVADLMEQRAAVIVADDMLSRLQGRRAAPSDLAGAPGLPAGSPFLEGPSVTVAGAALMQRVSGAVERLDGRITSSQVELQGNEFGAGFLGVTTNLEIAQPELQKLLYDLEAGMPFLFVDQLVAQGSTTGGESDDGRMRVLMTVYGQWQGAQ